MEYISPLNAPDQQFLPQSLVHWKQDPNHTETNHTFAEHSPRATWQLFDEQQKPMSFTT